MQKLIRFTLYYILGIIGILFISATPALFQSTHLIDISFYVEQLIELMKSIVQPENWTYYYLDRELSVISFLWDPYVYSTSLFIGALFLGFGLAFLLAIFTMFLPSSVKQIVKRVLGFLESIPDLMVAFLIQLLVVFIYQHTDILLMKFVTLGEERIYLAPIVVLSFLPMVSMYRVLSLLLDEEMTKPYVELARSKGLREHFIIVRHVLQNSMKSVFYQSKIIVWTTLSSLFVVEYIFNINGLSNFILSDFRPLVLTIGLTMIFTPLFLIYQGVEVFVFKEAYHSTTVHLKKKNNVKQKQLKIEKTQKVNPKLSFTAIKKYVIRLLKSFVQYMKNFKFITGFTVIFGLVIISFVHTISHDNPVQQYVLVYDDAGNLVSNKPHPPSNYVPMGSDYLGYSIKDQLLTGAKYTILFAASISLLRIFFGFLLAIPYAFFIKDKWQRWIRKCVDGFHYLPLTVISVVLLSSLLMGGVTGFSNSLTERILVQGLILTILVVPLVTVLIGNEMNMLLKKEFITGARVLGASRKQLISKHIMPHLGSKLGILFGQQFIQVLLLMIHLGLFQLFLGGTSVMYDQFYKAPKHSVTFEWSGLISNTREALMTGHYWIVVPVLVAFMIVIIAMQLMIEGIQEVQQGRVGIGRKKNRWRKKKSYTQENPETSLPVKPEQFYFH
ncbi:Dipeptide transport system permease protein DppB [Paraliobacillus sp. PM-2]|uniref:ABC transporter permease subunit n=1 Tax=Paraliobacillus sp. PM-2 TaxID=1462524 RepID=UPI00061BF1F4|nr:ABC transporter permease subunit [Paraliobacillus sp. PM-2]CQR46130.1 Dipeptide transport system permease protein DppB [Paraliobacillus sp. PM-2]